MKVGHPTRDRPLSEGNVLRPSGGKDAAYVAKWQNPRYYKISGLTAKPWHSAEDLGIASLLEERHEQIRDELLAIMSLQSYGGIFPIDGVLSASPSPLSLLSLTCNVFF